MDTLIMATSLKEKEEGFDSYTGPRTQGTEVPPMQPEGGCHSLGKEEDKSCL